MLVIDVQEYCSRPDRGCHRGVQRSDAPYFFDRVDHVMVPNVRRLQAAARAAGVEVVYTVIEALTLDGRDASLDYKLSGPLHVPRHHADAAVLPEIAPVGDEIVIPKTSCSVFCSTNINYVLRNLGTRYLLVCGQLTNQCVAAAVQHAADSGYLVTLVEDACAANTPEDHASGLLNLRGFARILSTVALVDELAPQRRLVSPPAGVDAGARRICVIRTADDPRYGARATQMAREMFAGIGALPHELVELDARAGQLPGDPAAFPAYLLLGSPSSVAADVPQEPWVEALLGCVRRLVAEQRPVVGICFGHQIVATALGGLVVRNPAGLQASRLSRAITNAGRRALGLAASSQEVALLYHHGDAVVLLPPGAESWGYCASGHWGMSLGPCCLTTQAHPEFSTDTGRLALLEILEHDRQKGPVDEGGNGGAALPQPDLDAAVAAMSAPTDHEVVARAFARVLGLLP